MHAIAGVPCCYHILHDLKGQSVDEQECALIWQMMRAQPVAFFWHPSNSCTSHEAIMWKAMSVYCLGTESWVCQCCFSKQLVFRSVMDCPCKVGRVIVVGATQVRMLF